MYPDYSYYFHESSVLWKILPFFILLDVVLRGFSLWHSARKKQKVWFIALLIVNSLGILPIIYLVFTHTKKTIPEKTGTKPSKKKASKTKTK